MIKESKIFAISFAYLFTGLAILILVMILSKSPTPPLTKTPFNSEEVFRFHAIGDYGQLLPGHEYSENLWAVQAVSNAMDERASEHPISMILSLGDNRYDSTDDELDFYFYQLLETVFNEGSLKGVPLHSVYGNHDCYTSRDFEMDMVQLYPEWNLYHTHLMTVPVENRKTVELIFLDACEMSCEDYEKNKLIWCSGFYPEPSTEEVNKEYEWLEKTLKEIEKKGTAVWVIVSIHYPLFNAGISHGDNEPTKKRLYPILSKYRVDVVLSGHEHLAEHMVSSYGEEYFELDEKKEYNCSFGEFVGGGKKEEYLKGEKMHEIVIGSSGYELDEICVEKTTPMAELRYAHSNAWSFLEVEASDSYLKFRIEEALPKNQLLYELILKI